MPEMIPDAELLVTLRAFYEAYAACLDDQDFNRWPEFFSETATYRVQSFENHERGLPHAAIYCEGRAMLLDRVSATDVLVYEMRRQRRMIYNLLVKSDVDGVIQS
jgi:anthranilate 1,2-dioxygenase small subunit